MIKYFISGCAGLISFYVYLKNPINASLKIKLGYFWDEIASRLYDAKHCLIFIWILPQRDPLLIGTNCKFLRESIFFINSKFNLINAQVKNSYQSC